MNEIIYTSPKQVLDTLGKTDFRHITKDDVIKLFGMMQNMDQATKDVVLKNFNLYIVAAKQAIVEFCKATEEALKSNKTISETNAKSCEAAIKALQTIIEKDQLDSEHLFEVAKMIRDLQNQQNELANKALDYNNNQQNYLGYVVAGVMVMLVGFLTTKSGINLPNKFKSN